MAVPSCMDCMYMANFCLGTPLQHLTTTLAEANIVGWIGGGGAGLYPLSCHVQKKMVLNG